MNLPLLMKVRGGSFYTMVIRTIKNESYTTMCNAALIDPNLSLKAKGLWAFIMSKPDGWNINYRGLMTQLKEGQVAILAALKELEDCHYLVRGQIKNDAGKFTQGDSVLYEMPCLEQEAIKPICVEKPCVENPRAVGPRTKVNTDKVITEEEISTNVLIGETPEVYGKPELNSLFNYWEQCTGVALTAKRQANRNACNNLYKQWKLEGVRKLIDGVALSQQDQYAPRIADFCDLQAKLNQLMTWGKAKQTNQRKVIKI